MLEYLRAVGVDYLFGVPGTNEIPLIDGTTPSDSGVSYIPCLHENIALGAAMGYARAAGKPGVVELHVTPGAAHGIGNLYNAYKSHVSIVVLCAQQHNELVVQEPLLASDLVQVARQYTKWAYEVRSPVELSLVLQRAFKEAMAPPTRPVFIAIPWDFLIAPVARTPARVTRVATNFAGDATEVGRAAQLLAAAKSPVIVAGDGAGAAQAWPELQRLADLIGATVYTESLSSYMNYPNNLDHWGGELPSTQAQMQALLEGNDVAFLCGYNAQAQVVVFDYSAGPMIPEDITQIYLHDDEWEIGKNAFGDVAILGGIKTTLGALCAEVAAQKRDEVAVAGRLADLRARGESRAAATAARKDARSRAEAGEPLTGEDVAIALAAVQPKMQSPLVLVNEAVSDSLWFQEHLVFDEPSSYFFAQGGSLGFSMPASLGVKLGAGDQKTVVNVVGDGSALFYPHAWWTTRKFDLPILYVIANNHEYKTLLLGLSAIEKIIGWQPLDGDPWYLHLQEPPLSFVDLARAFGVPGSLATTRAELDAGLAHGLAALAKGQPYVLEVLTDPSLTPPPTQAAAMPRSRKGDEDGGAELIYLGPP